MGPAAATSVCALLGRRRPRRLHVLALDVAHQVRLHIRRRRGRGDAAPAARVRHHLFPGSPKK